MNYDHVTAGDPRKAHDWTSRWAELTPLTSTNGQVLDRIRRFCKEKRIVVDDLAMLGTRIAIRRGGSVFLAFAGRNAAGIVTAIKYRPLEGSSHDTTAEHPSVWLRPIIVGRRESLDWFVAEGETEAARLCGLVRNEAAILCLPAGARTFRREWADLIPRGATVHLAHDADLEGDAGAEKAGRIIGGRTVRVRPPEGVKDWCDWPGDREAFVELVGAARAAQPAASLLVRGVDWDRVRPTRWLWERRLPLGYLSLLVGDEGVGKGTATAWIAARATCGELEGDQLGTPLRVLIVGDEDAFEPIWVPRLYAAGADLTRVLTLDDGDYLTDFTIDGERLGRAIEREGIGLVVFDQLLDHVSGGHEGEAVFNPKSVRQALVPLRRVAALQGIAALGLLHPVKGHARSFRDLVAGSHQFNAVSRSSLLLGVDPENDKRRVLVRGKGNYSALPRSFEFTLAAEVVDLNRETFEVSKVVDAGEGDRTVDDILKAAPSSPIRDELAERLEPLLTDEEQTRADLARAVGRDPKDGSVKNALDLLASRGIAEQTKGGGWKRA